MLRGGAKALWAQVQLTEVAATAPGGDQYHVGGVVGAWGGEGGALRAGEGNYGAEEVLR